MKYKIKIKRKKKPLKSIYIVFILIIILTCIGTSYSIFTRTLYINGTVVGSYEDFPLPDTEPVVPQNNPDRLSTNTNMTGGLLNVQVFTHVEDEQESYNTIVTKIRNGTKTWITNTIDITFSMSIKNNSSFDFTNGRVEVTEYDPSNYITSRSQTISPTTVTSGNTTTLTAVIRFAARNNIPVGSYVNYKISFNCEGQTRYYNYKVLIVS